MGWQSVVSLGEGGAVKDGKRVSDGLPVERLERLVEVGTSCFCVGKVMEYLSKRCS